MLSRHEQAERLSHSPPPPSALPAAPRSWAQQGCLGARLPDLVRGPMLRVLVMSCQARGGGGGSWCWGRFGAPCWRATSLRPPMRRPPMRAPSIRRPSPLPPAGRALALLRLPRPGPRRQRGAGGQRRRRGQRQQRARVAVAAALPRRAGQRPVPERLPARGARGAAGQRAERGQARGVPPQVRGWGPGVLLAELELLGPGPVAPQAPCGIN